MSQRRFQPMGGNVVGVNEGPLFDSVAHTQGGTPHLMQFLWDAYVADLKVRIERRRAVGTASVKIAEAAERATAKDFLRFATEYLTRNRFASTFFVDENIGIRLTNHRSVSLSPGVQIQGTMQDAGAVQITHGLSQEGTEEATGGEENIHFGI